MVSSNRVAGHQGSQVTSSGAKLRSAATMVDTEAPSQSSDWRQKARPIKPGSTYPAKELCSHCGLCDTYYVAHVKDSCAFLGDGEDRPCPQLLQVFCSAEKCSDQHDMASSSHAGMSKIERLEPVVHGRSRCECPIGPHQSCRVWSCFRPSITTSAIADYRDLQNLDDLHFGIPQEMLYARASPAVPGAQVSFMLGQCAAVLLLDHNRHRSRLTAMLGHCALRTLRSGRAS